MESTKLKKYTKDVAQEPNVDQKNVQNGLKPNCV